MENLIALSPIITMFLLFILLVSITVLIVKRVGNSKNNSEAERRIRELEEENKRLKNSNSHK